MMYSVKIARRVSTFSSISLTHTTVSLLFCIYDIFSLHNYNYWLAGLFCERQANICLLGFSKKFI